MLLKEIELQGFKSFPNKTEIAINSGITGIVGPNGSGKSNISDAVRWVLGEQSLKTLRGTRGEDVIFSGTDTRRPLNYAQVSIKFNNESGQIPIDYNEVVVTRRVFRHGENEYYINNNQVRLKDVRSLFMDTGFGKDGYALIGQGQIDSVLSDQPEARRSLFEEAAGISKFKYDKNEATRRIERVEKNLVRITDSQFTTEKFLKQLENDAKKAKEYQRLFNELKMLELKNSAKEYDKFQEKIEEVNQSMKDLDLQVHDFDSEEAELTHNIQTIKKSLVELNENREAIDHEYREISNELQIIISEQQKVHSNIDNNLAKLSLYKEEQKNLMIEIESIEDRLESLNTNYISINNDLENYNSKRISLKEEKQDFISNNKAIVDEYNSHKYVLNDLEENILKNNLLFEDYLRQETQHKENVKDLGNFVFEQEEKIQQLDIELNKERDNEKDFRTKLTAENKNLREFENKIQYLQEANDQLENEKNQLIYDINRCSSRKDYLTEAKESYQGYYYGIKNFMNDLAKTKKNFGIIDTFGELLSFERKYSLAIEASAGYAIQNIVIEKAEDINHVKQFIKNKKYGKITFLPLDTVKPFKIKPAKIKAKGFIDYAINLVIFDEKYQNIMSNVFKNTLVFDNYDHALAYGKMIGFSSRIITLQGDTINIGGSITVESTTKKSGKILISEKDIVALTNEIKNLELKKESINESIESNKKDLNTYKKRAEETRSTRETLLNKIQEVEVCISKNNHEREMLKNNIVYQKKQTQNYEDKLSLIKTSMAKLKAEIRNDEEQLEKVRNDSAIIDEYDEFNRTVQDYEEQWQSLEIQYQKLISKREFQQEQIGYEKNREANKNDRKEELDSLIASLNDVIPTLEDKENELDDKIKIKKEILSEKELDLNRMRNKINESNIELESYNLDYNYFKDQRHQLDLEQIKLENKKERLRSDLQAMLERIFEQYELTEQAVKEVDRSLLDVIKKKDITTLKQKINQLGEINPQAIFQYEEVLEEFETLEKQRIDLTESKKKLNDFIIEIEKNMKEQFASAIKDINEYFKETFSQLFNGGDAKITIDEDEDLLEANISIYAQPPGKRLQNLTLLSGGEKALTAVALLFALLKKRPSPFCILDEIDAALDESNIVRYTEFLKSIAHKTQFIIITHRKPTMEIANILYGITMEQKGISKVIPLELDEYKK